MEPAKREADEVRRKKGLTGSVRCGRRCALRWTPSLMSLDTKVFIKVTRFYLLVSKSYEDCSYVDIDGINKLF